MLSDEATALDIVDGCRGIAARAPGGQGELEPLVMDFVEELVVEVGIAEDHSVDAAIDHHLCPRSLIGRDVQRVGDEGGQSRFPRRFLNASVDGREHVVLQAWHQHPDEAGPPRPQTRRLRIGGGIPMLLGECRIRATVSGGDPQRRAASPSVLRTREIVDGLIPSSVAIMRSVSGPFCDASTARLPGHRHRTRSLDLRLPNEDPHNDQHTNVCQK